MILMIDNFDSFTYNIVQYLGELGCNPEVIRNNDITPEKLKTLDVEKLIVSPGPCTPKEAGISCEAIKFFAEKSVPVLGVCLGHQCIGEVFGGKVIHAPYLMHGKISEIFHNGKGIFKGLASPFKATRYHSLIIDKQSFPEAALEITAWTEDGLIMGVEHKKLKVYGVQFHPESILTEDGHKLLGNFLSVK
ncbi:MAG: anthranilate/aminodeoxychorismate synthase component II [Lentisphaerae bacterium GWF2_44_16]|nr:MAG: anthranilate/aminodeoxychorismate synthase component II [Lentisphaerae bacterium GWF2_44_16]